MKRVIGYSYLIISVCLLIYGGLLLHERFIPITPPAYKPAAVLFPDAAMTIHIPSVGIMLPVYNATITGSTWQTTKRGVSYLSTSPLPGDQGNSVFYGHNWPNILTKLHNVKPGEAIFVTRKEKTSRFIIQYIAVVKANDHSVYAPSKDTRLTIYTCTGFLDRDRLVVTAFPELL